MANQQLTLLPQNRVVQRFIKRYRIAEKYCAETTHGDAVAHSNDKVYHYAIIACFADCFNLTFADAERYLKEHSQ